MSASIRILLLFNYNTYLVPYLEMYNFFNYKSEI